MIQLLVFLLIVFFVQCVFTPQYAGSRLFSFILLFVLFFDTCSGYNPLIKVNMSLTRGDMTVRKFEISGSVCSLFFLEPNTAVSVFLLKK